MFILEKPYVSNLMIDTIVQKDWRVLENEAIKASRIEEGALNLVNNDIAINHYLAQEYPLLYTNSENGLKWVLDNLPQSHLADYIRTFKNKAEFRKFLVPMFPKFYYREVDFYDLKSLSLNEIQFPVVIKPSVGFLGFGANLVKTAGDFNNVVRVIEKETRRIPEGYSVDVLNTKKFIIEEYIEGDEFAVDAYYDRDGEPVILNIFKHPYLKAGDINDRIHMTSTGIMVKYMAKFAHFFRELSKLKDIRNFPFHAELRIKEDGTIVPVEINPMRFASWCSSDIAKYAWGINIYECFYEKIRPNWNEILEKSGRGVYFYTMLEIPWDMNKNLLRGFNYEEFLENFSNVLELRRLSITENPIMGVIFAKTEDPEEIRKVLSLDVL